MTKYWLQPHESIISRFEQNGIQSTKINIFIPEPYTHDKCEVHDYKYDSRQLQANATEDNLHYVIPPAKKICASSMIISIFAL